MLGLIAETGYGTGQEAVERLKIEGPVMGARGPTPETLEWVSLTYELCLLLGDPPTKTVEHFFRIAPRTATYWVKLARERGHLDL